MATKQRTGLSTAKRTALVGAGVAVALGVAKVLGSRGRPEAAVAKLLEDSRAGKRDTVSGAEMGRTLRLLRKRSAPQTRERAKA